MFGFLKTLFGPPTPAGPPKTLCAFGAGDQPITRDGVSRDGDAWQIESREPRTVRLFEVPSPGIEQSIVTYRARARCADLRGRAYLEMWCRFPGQGEFFSRGLQQAVTGTADWASYETPFFLKKGQRPDLITLNLVVEGSGTVWLADIQLLATPLA
jgi:hypothetical protein